MRYKTIVLELLQQNPELHDRLRRQRTLLATLGRFTDELKASHEAWKDRLAQANPGSSEAQIASEALEIALKGLQDRLSPASEDSDSFNLEAAMAFLRRHTPPE